MTQAMAKTDIRSCDLTELTELVQALGEKKFRALQICQWLHQKLMTDFEQMTNISPAFRRLLMQRCELTVLKPAQIQVSALDGTRKYLFVLPDGNVIESVRMKYKHGSSVCISSQAGCRMGCRFCASAIGGLVRNLSPAEMLEQVYRIQEDTGERVSHVVVMGTGEPLDNYDNLIKFIRILTDEHGLHISQRNITVSTCGIVPGIYRLAEERLAVTLALSLHAPSQKKRRELMPVAADYKLEEVLKACEYYFARTKRRVTYEYSLIGGVNDSPEDAERLAGLSGIRNGHVNLIPVNPVRERSYVQSAADVMNAFKNKLEKNGINVTIRRELGRDINGACGQLRKSYQDSMNRTLGKAGG